MNQPDRVQICLKQMMERMNQERMLQNLLPVEWFVQILPFLYEQHHIRFDFGRLAQSIQTWNESLKNQPEFIAWIRNVIQYFSDQIQTIPRTMFDRTMIPTIQLELQQNDHETSLIFSFLEDRFVELFQTITVLNMQNQRSTTCVIHKNADVYHLVMSAHFPGNIE